MFSGEFKKDIFEMRRYVNFLSPFRNNKLIIRLLTILQGFLPNKVKSVINNLKEFFQIKEYEVPLKLIALLGEIIIGVSSRPNIPNKSQYFTQDIMIDLIDMLSCIIHGYFSSTPRELIDKLVEYFDLIVSLNELVYFDIMSSYRELGIRVSRMEAKIIETREYFISESIFSVQNYSWRTVLSVRIINNKLKIVVTPGRYIDSPIFKRFNDKEYIFILNLKKIKEDKAELETYFKNLIKFYYGPLDIEKHIILNIISIDELIEKNHYIEAKELLEYNIHQAEKNQLTFLENYAKEIFKKYKKFWQN